MILGIEVLSGVELWAAQEKLALGASMTVVVAMLITVLKGTTSARCWSRWQVW
jgi:Ni,Fe-hydrogenase I cytochrome b subunit